MKTVFECVRLCGHRLYEKWNGTAFEMVYATDTQAHTLSMYTPAALLAGEERSPYLGMDAETLLASGRDILTERLLEEGEPSLARVEGLLPRIEKGAYAFFGGAVSWSGVELDLEAGVLYSQVCENNNVPTEALFDPRSEDEVLGAHKPYVCLLNASLPIVCSVHTDGKDVIEFLYFIEAGDPDRDPVVWIRTKRYALSSPCEFTLGYQLVSRSRVIRQHEIAQNTLYTALSDTVAYWLRFSRAGAAFTLPEKRLERLIIGTQIAAAVTFSGDHPHYGHRYYGKEFHDHFPPNFLWSLEACCVQGRLSWGRRILQHLFAYSLTDEGRFVYRQGNDELFGASACEYAQLIWLLQRYAEPLGLSAEYTEQLLSMGRYLLSHLRPCREPVEGKLIHMCAEADSNTRVHAYINNNLWCVRGFSSLASLLVRLGYEGEEVTRFRHAADELYATLLRVLDAAGVYDERFGHLPPFRIGYTATPATLSACRDTFFPMTKEEYRAYARRIDMREQGSDVQEYTENCYANYRYYPEMLGAMLLPDRFADGVATLRRTLGGELLCMTRFMGHLDDWPVLHYARFLLERGEATRFLTLLYAHACHHGRPELCCFYEQVSANGRVMAEDCIPSLLTIPIMAAWAFAYERMSDGELCLLSAIPTKWYEEGFSCTDVGFSAGKVSISATSKQISVSFSSPPMRPYRLVLRHRAVLNAEDILQGGEHILALEGNTLLLSGKEREISILLR